jgi:low temperature requirement protein LtrA
MTTETGAGRRVRPLELFFDLVFVFAITQVTGLMSADPTWPGLGRGLLVLGAIWWAWGSYSWLTNTIDPDAPVGRLSVLAAMTAMLIVALAVPEAFGSDALLFACAYFVVRALHIVVYAYAAEEVTVQAAARALAPTSIAAPALLVGAGFLDGAAQAVVWCVALAIDYSGPYLRGVEGLTVSPSHFAERYGLIVIIALGESIVAIGVGVAGRELGAGEIAAATGGLAVAAAMWWTYFDVVAVVAERRLSEASGHARARLARDSYSYLHLPLIAGVVLVALAIKKTLEHVGEPLEEAPAVALCAGVALYLLALVAFRLRVARTLNVERLVAAAVSLALLPLALSTAALAALAAVAALLAALVAFEAIRFRAERATLASREQLADLTPPPGTSPRTSSAPWTRP